jgi:nitrate/nitrite transporter NarK
MSTIVLGTILMGWFRLPWQVALWVMGLAGVMFGLTFLILFRNSPADHPRVNGAECSLIAEGGTTKSQHGTLPWSRALRNRSLQFFVVQQFLDAGSDLVFLSLIGQYFEERHGQKIDSIGWLASLPLWGGALGGIAGGWLNDRMIRTSGNRRWSRSGIGFVGKAIGCSLLFVVSIQNGPVAAGIALMFAKFFSDWSQPTTWGTCTDLGGRCSATVFSIINTAGTIGGIVMPIVFGKLLDWNTTSFLIEGKTVTKTDWGPLFILVAAMYLCSGIFWLLIDCTKSLNTDNDSEGLGHARVPQA